MYYAQIELNYSPADLLEMYSAPRKFKAMLYGNISYKLDQLAKEAKQAQT
ncbi:hypothetical protein [Sporosarcina sp. Marseille-Q4943]|nr:hypothetical protein [Sporosarcina sp. Marseille-Q4943]